MFDISNLSVTTTAHETFSGAEHAELARLVYKRFGRDEEAATAAWRRMLGNDCPVSDFMALVKYQGDECGMCGCPLAEDETSFGLCYQCR